MGLMVNFVFFLGMEQKIWVDIGESDAEKDRMLMELEKECLEIYRRKVDEAANSKAQLHQSLVSIEAEVASIMAALGVLNIHSPVGVLNIHSPVCVHLVSEC